MLQFQDKIKLYISIKQLIIKNICQHNNIHILRASIRYHHNLLIAIFINSYLVEYLLTTQKNSKLSNLKHIFIED